MTQDSRQAALDYHTFPKPGKLSIALSKPTETQADLALAYTPGVAEPVRAIVEDPEAAYRYTAKPNLVGVITNGTAVLGLGDVGALAAKPVMEGKAVFLKRFADIDAFDIEVDASDPQDFIRTVAHIAPTFGGIHLEDIKAPQCFEIEQALIERLDIPVFHDDQHGTAIVILAGLLNALELQQKKLSEIRIVCLGAGAAGIASMRLLTALGVKREQIMMVDRQGVIHTGRSDLNPYKVAFAAETTRRTLSEALVGADVFIGVSGPRLVTPEMLQAMEKNPIVFALSNPDAEIDPALALEVRPDMIMATGRSDYPNQVNNVLCYPYVFRGALDVRATCIHMEMMLQAAFAVQQLAKAPVPDSILEAYQMKTSLSFGKSYILPKPMDPRLLPEVSSAVARAAVEAKVAKLPYPAQYKETLLAGAGSLYLKAISIVRGKVCQELR